MREILFRGRRCDSYDWLYGAYLVVGGIQHYIWPNDDSINSINEYYKVDAETVGQYTGLPDKKGVKIFEGDILSTTNSNCRMWYVDYKNGSYYANQGNVNYSCELWEFLKTAQVEVVGNVFDNPELLKGMIKKYA